MVRAVSVLLRLLIRAASGPAVPAAAAAAHSAAHLMWPRGLSAAASQSPAGPLHTEQGSVSRYFPWENGQKLGCRNNQFILHGDLEEALTCTPLGADMTASLARPARRRAQSAGPNDTSFVQNSFLTGLEAPRECQHTGRATR